MRIIMSWAAASVVVAGLPLASSVQAQTQSIRRQVWNGATLSSQFDYASGAPITIPLTSSATRVNLFSVGTGALADIGSTTFTGTAPSAFDLVIGQDALNENFDANLTDAANNWTGVALPSGVRLSGAIAGTLDGSINPRSIVRLEVNGVLNGAITTSTTSGTAIGYLQVGSATADGTVSAAGGSIAILRSTDPTLPFRGAITVPAGSIGELSFAAGVLISTGGIHARDGINSIRSGYFAGDDFIAKDLSAAISTTGAINDLWCGDLGGSITAAQLYDGFTNLFTAMKCGVVSAPLVFTDSVRADIEVEAFVGEGGLTIGGDLNGSLRAHGNITHVTVQGSIEPTGIFDDLEITSATGSIGSIIAGFSIQPKNAGNFLYIRSPISIGRVECQHLQAIITAGTTANAGPIGEIIVPGNFNSGSVVSGRSIARFDVGVMHFYSFLSFREMCCTPTALPGPRIGRMEGHIDITAQPEGYGPLTFPIITNAALSVGGAFQGSVRWGAGSTTHTITSPLYTETEAELGGGSIGVAPFELKRNECSPPSPCITLPCALCLAPTGCPPNAMPRLTREEFEGGELFILSFYGPILTNPGPGRPVLHLYKADQRGVAYGDDYGDLLQCTAVGHKLVIQGSSSIPNGRYILKQGVNDFGLLPNHLIAAPTQHVKPFNYHFVLFSRQDGQGDTDSECSDFNGDGDIGTDQDIEAFFACLGGACCQTCPHNADVNCDGDIGNDADIEDFFRALGGVQGICDNCSI